MEQTTPIGYQCKHFPRGINWTKCVGSLDTAVDHYKGLREVVFYFSKDLTDRERNTFNKRLVGRHPGVEVSYVGRSRILSTLLESKNGTRVVERFLGHTEPDRRYIERMVNAGGAVETAEDMHVRLAALSETANAKDNRFGYRSSSSDGSMMLPPIPGDAVMAYERSDGRSVTRVEAVPRDIERYKTNPIELRIVGQPVPGFERALQRLWRAGGTMDLPTGLNIEIVGLPEFFDPIPQDDETTISLRVDSGLWPWKAKIAADTTTGKACVELDLHHRLTATGSTISGIADGITFEILVAETRATTNVRYNPEGLPNDAALRGLQFFIALHGSGTLTLDDKLGHRPAIAVPSPGVDRDLDEANGLEAILAAAVVIEAWTRKPVRLPEVISAEEGRHLLRTAERLRNRLLPVTVTKNVIQYEGATPAPVGGLMRLDQSFSWAEEFLESRTRLDSWPSE